MKANIYWSGGKRQAGPYTLKTILAREHFTFLQGEYRATNRALQHSGVARVAGETLNVYGTEGPRLEPSRAYWLVVENSAATVVVIVYQAKDDPKPLGQATFEKNGFGGVHEIRALLV